MFLIHLNAKDRVLFYLNAKDRATLLWNIDETVWAMSIDQTNHNGVEFGIWTAQHRDRKYLYFVSVINIVYIYWW